jgi:single-strand DNA-binding protein
MNDLNSVLIEGNMIRDPLSKYDEDEKKYVTTFTIASNRYFNEGSGIEKEVNFFDIEADGRLAAGVTEIGKKGKGVRIVGRLRQDRWDDDENKHHSRVVIVPEHIEFRPDFKTKETEQELDFDGKEKCVHDYLRIITGIKEGDYECTHCGDIKTQQQLRDSGEYWSD